MTHTVRYDRRNTGWRRWTASCTCGWHTRPEHHDDAHKAGNKHLAEMGA